jgi:hypothetical protein
MAWLCSTQRALPAPGSSGSLTKTPSHLEFARWPEGASLPPPGHPFWCAAARAPQPRTRAIAGLRPRMQPLALPGPSFLPPSARAAPCLLTRVVACRRNQPHAADVAAQALASLRRDKQNCEAQLATALDARNMNRSAFDKLTATLAAVQARPSRGRSATPRARARAQRRTRAARQRGAEAAQRRPSQSPAARRPTQKAHATQQRADARSPSRRRHVTRRSCKTCAASTSR